ncbi:MAG: hypothetical protein JW759_06085 [Candidatus Coatesbacteria bacterium]|nr:hypothetical protein [Candidatus Coatesbacteria bacterium]
MEASSAGRRPQTGRRGLTAAVDVLLTLLLLLVIAADATASGPSEKSSMATWSISSEVEYGHVLEAGLDEGNGWFSLYESGARLSIRRLLGKGSLIGLNLDLALLDFDLKRGANPVLEKSGRFDQILESKAGFNVVITRGDWSYTGLLAVGAAGEDHALDGDAGYIQGAVGLVHQWTPTVRVGFGLFVKTRIEDDALIAPFIMLEYRATEDLTVAIRNGLSIDYQLEEERTYLTFEAKYDSHRFRLDDTEPLPAGVVDYERVPVSVGIRHRFSEYLTARASVGAILWHRFELSDRNGKDLGDTEADPTAVLRAAVGFDF